ERELRPVVAGEQEQGAVAEVLAGGVVDEPEVAVGVGDRRGVPGDRPPGRRGVEQRRREREGGRVEGRLLRPRDVRPVVADGCGTNALVDVGPDAASRATFGGGTFLAPWIEQSAQPRSSARKMTTCGRSAARRPEVDTKRRMRAHPRAASDFPSEFTAATPRL